MTVDSQNFEALLKAQEERDKEILSEVQKNIAETFPDPAQSQVVFDLYQQLYKVTGDTQELNHGSIFLNSYIDAFHKLLVGEGKMFTDDEFKELSSEAYTQAINDVLQASQAMQQEADK